MQQITCTITFSIRKKASFYHYMWSGLRAITDYDDGSSLVAIVAEKRATLCFDGHGNEVLT